MGFEDGGLADSGVLHLGVHEADVRGGEFGEVPGA